MVQAKRRPLEFQTFDAVRADIAQLKANGYEQAGTWTLAQILDHLARAMGPLPAGIKPAPAPLRWFFRLFMKRVVRTRKMPRVPAPRGMKPPPAADLADAEPRFNAALDAAESRPAGEILHPMFGMISVADWQQLQLVHATRHLSFLVPKKG
ncbi:MAG: DUF1569 domain-containing protein [Tepidisphaeraceae bacterium]